jgi:dihydrolipoamide dehydrogenase
VSADVKAVVDRSRGVSARLNGGIGFLMKKNKVDVIWGEAKLTKPNEIVVGKSSKPAMRSRSTRRRRARRARAHTLPSTSSLPPARPAHCPAWSRTAS